MIRYDQDGGIFRIGIVIDDEQRRAGRRRSLTESRSSCELDRREENSLSNWDSMRCSVVQFRRCRSRLHWTGTFLDLITIFEGRENLQRKREDGAPERSRRATLVFLVRKDYLERRVLRPRRIIESNVVDLRDKSFSNDEERRSEKEKRRPRC